MARRRGTTLPLILALMLLAVAMMLLLAPATVPTPPLPQGANVQGTPLATEIQPREIVARFNIHIVPGSVYEITQDINGLRLAQKSLVVLCCCFPPTLGPAIARLPGP